MFNIPLTLKKAIALVMSLAAMLAAIGPVTFSPADADSLLLNFSVISDTHVAPLFDSARGILLARGLRDMAKAEVKSDALIISGDMTESGTITEYYKLGSELKALCKADNLLPEMGNHDIRGIKTGGEYSQTYEYGAGKYKEFMKDAAGIAPDTVYYCKIIKGCYFIVLNTEAAESNQTYISPAQISWMDGLLAQAETAGNPVFIVNHQPLKYIGDEAAAIESVLQKYNGELDIFFISGHYHNGFSAQTITNDGTLYFVDMPSYGKAPDGEYNKTGSGFQVELYADEIIFRARNFANGLWESGFDRTIELLG